jgi:hypothetical protein
VNQADVEVVLRRLPAELWRQLRGVHFNDQAWGTRTLGYVNRSRHDIISRPPGKSSRLWKAAQDWVLSTGNQIGHSTPRFKC